MSNNSNSLTYFFKQLFKNYIQTFKNIGRNSSILTTMILSVFFYSFFYPIAYQSQTAESLPIVIVDEEQSLLTSQIISAVSNSPNIKITQVLGDFEEAKYLVQTQKADGILLLPEHFSESILRGDSGGIGLYLSSANFLKTKQIGVGLAASIENTITEHLARFTQISHFSPKLPIHQIPLFNTLSGYGSYIFPAVAPLIIHQTLLLGLCMLIAGYREQKWKASYSEFLAIYLVALTIGCLGCFYLFGFTFWLNDYPRGGNFTGMLLAVPIYISAVTGLAFVFASFLDQSDRAGHIIVFSSVPLFLLSGTAWPLQAMPQWMQYFSAILPSTQGINLFVQLNQMGVSTYLVIPKLIYLLVISIILLSIAWYRIGLIDKKKRLVH